MNREIKFRAWDGSKMTSDFLLCAESGACCSYRYHELDEEIWTVMQYTGLKDKNGNPIFEGDVVGGVLYKDYSEHIGKIQFDYNGYVIVTSDKSMSLALTEKLTVIGNIHENPELLK